MMKPGTDVKGALVSSAGAALEAANEGLTGGVSLGSDGKAFIEKHVREVYNMGRPIYEGETVDMRKERLKEDVLTLKQLGGNTKQFLGDEQGLVSHDDRKEVLKQLFFDKFKNFTTSKKQLEADIDSMNKAHGSLSDFIGQNGGLIAHNDRCDAIFCQKVSQKAENKETLRVDGGGDKKKGLEQLKQDVKRASQAIKGFEVENFIHIDGSLKNAQERNTEISNHKDSEGLSPG